MTNGPADRPVAQTKDGTLRKLHGAHPPVPHRRPCLEAARRHVHDDPVLSLVPLDDALVECPRDEGDRAVPAGSRVAGIVEEDDAEVGPDVVCRHDVTSVHVGVAARLEHEEPADVVQALQCIAAPRENRLSAQRLDTSGDDAERLAAGVIIVDADLRQRIPRSALSVVREARVPPCQQEQVRMRLHLIAKTVDE